MRHLELGQIDPERGERCEEVPVSLREQAEWN